MRAEIQELIGQQIGHYQLKAYIGAGVNGKVFHAEHTAKSGSSYALKLLNADLINTADHGAMTAQAATAAQVRHAHLCAIVDWGESEQGWYCVSEFIAGPENVSFNLQKYWHRLPRQRVSPAQVFSWALQIGKALQAVHKANQIHGHLNPANILLDANGNVHLCETSLAPDQSVKHIIAQLHDSLHSDGGSTTTVGSGSLRKNTQAMRAYYYLAPEQRRQASIGNDPRSDIYAFGMLLFRMLTGVYPRHDRQKPSLLVTDLDPQWDEIIVACLADDPAQRPASIAAVGKKLKSRFKSVSSTAAPLLTSIVLLSATVVGAAISQVILRYMTPKAPPVAESFISRNIHHDQNHGHAPEITLNLTHDDSRQLHLNYLHAGKKAFADGRWQEAANAFTNAQALPGGDQDWLLQLYLARIDGARAAETALWARKARQHSEQRLREFTTGINQAKTVLVTLENINSETLNQLLEIDAYCHLQLATLHSLQTQEVWQHFPSASAIALAKMDVELREVRRQVQSKLPNSALPLAGRDWTIAGLNMEFVWIEPMRCWVGRYEISNGQYRAFNAEHDSGRSGDYSLNGDNQPVVQVNYIEANEFAAWLSQREQELGRLPRSWRYRLPTGSEWDQLASCGDGRIFPWGNSSTPPSTFNYRGQENRDANMTLPEHHDRFIVSAPIDQSGSNDWGLFGVGGNVWEWTSEGFVSEKPRAWYQYIRGGSWYESELRGLSCEFRRPVTAGSRRSVIGFRLVLAPAIEPDAGAAVQEQPADNN